MKLKRLLSLLLTFALLTAALTVPTSAAAVSDEDAAQTLSALGLMQGTGSGFELERSATRAEALTMLLRLLGRETAALQEQTPCPFDDGGWAAQRIAYAWKNGLINGQSETHFGSAESVSVRDWLTMLLRALGYSDAAGDFSWEQSIAFADRIGLTHGEYTADSEFLRGDLALLSCNALSLKLKGSGVTLAERLYLDGVISAAALRTTRLSGVLAVDSASKPVYNGVEIHEKFAPATFLFEGYASREDLEADKPSVTGSGFFITADGVAALCYHELEGLTAARVTTLDGRRFDITGVLFYDPLWDAAVVRVSRTDTDGNAVRFFPYLELGDYDAVRPGETVYTLSCPLGFVDSITDGMVSNCHRDVNDPDYLYLQFSAPMSSGSSGGAVLNNHGEVIGFHFAMFVSGQNMYLAVPVSIIADVDRTEEGIPLANVKDAEAKKKAAAVLTAEKAELSLSYGEEAEVLISHDGPGMTSIRYEIDGWDIVECAWGDFITKRSVPLTIKAIGNGKAIVTICFVDEDWNVEGSTEIVVTASGAPEEPAEELPYGDTGY